MKAKFGLYVWLAGESAVYAVALYWLVGISVRLDIVLACVITGILYTLRHVQHNLGLFNINDAELVRVSALANRLEEQVSELQDQLEAARNEMDDLKDETTRSDYRFDERMARYIGGRISDAELRIDRLHARLKRAGIDAE